MLYKMFLCGGDFRLPLFVTFMNGIRALLQCFMRHARGKEDGLNAFVSGFVGAYIGLMFENKNNWYTWRMYLGGRAIDMVYNGLVNRGYLKRSGWNYTIGFAIASTLIAKGYFHEPNIIENDVFKLYASFAKLSEGEKTWHLVQVDLEEKMLERSYGRPLRE